MVLVGEAVDDGGLDLAADPAVGADRDRTPDVGPEELGLRPDVAGPLHPRERLNPDVGADHDGTGGRVEDRVRIDPRGVVNAKQVRRADQGQGRELAVGHADLAALLKITLDVGPVPGHEVPGPVHPLAAHLAPLVPFDDPLEPGIDPVRMIKRNRIFRADQGKGRLPLAEPDRGTVDIGRLEIPREVPSGCSPR